MNLTKSESLRTKIIARMKELDYKQSFIINDASERGVKIASDRFSKYLNRRVGGLTEDQLLWIATRLGIYVNINFGELKIKDGVPVFEIPKYDELEALKRLARIFPPKTKNNG